MGRAIARREGEKARPLQYDRASALRTQTSLKGLRNMRHKLLSGAFAVLLVSALSVVAPSAEAAVFKFADVADGGPVSWTSVTGTGEAGYASFMMTVGGITVTATASNMSGAGSPFVYLDSKSGGRPAGMGVCQTLTGSAQCTPSGDDNITTGEILTLAFSTTVTLDGASFRDADHFASFAAGDQFQFDDGSGGGFGAVAFASDGVWTPAGISGTTFKFKYDNEQFYIETLTATGVPEPATLGLLGFGLLAAAGMRRRRRS